MARITHQKQWKPKNVREVVLEGFDLHEGFSVDEDTFTGANSIVRRGEFEPDGAHLKIPYVARIAWGKPRPIHGNWEGK